MGTGWHAVALSDDVAPGTSSGTRLFDRELVIWRDTGGAAHVWEDRCPHRGMRLSFGFVRGAALACLYHGWQYAADGRCRFIPAHPELAVPDTIRVATFPAQDISGMIWVGLDPAAAAPGMAGVEAARPVRSIAIEKPVQDVRRHLLAGTAETREDLLVVRVGKTELICAQQVYTADKSVLHIVMTGQDMSRKSAAIWAEDLRSAVEAGR